MIPLDAITVNFVVLHLTIIIYIFYTFGIKVGTFYTILYHFIPYVLFKVIKWLIPSIGYKAEILLYPWYMTKFIISGSAPMDEDGIELGPGQKYYKEDIIGNETNYDLDKNSKNNKELYLTKKN